MASPVSVAPATIALVRDAAHAWVQVVYVMHASSDGLLQTEVPQRYAEGL